MILSILFAQGAFEMVHRNVLFPTPNPVIVVFGLFGEAIVPDPPTKLHTPVPAVGVLAVMTALDVTQTVWSGPAAETDGIEFVVIVMLETDDAQGGLLIDHVSTVCPGEMFVTVVFLKRGLVIVPEPETKTHIPEPAAGAFPAKVAFAVPVVAQSVCEGPAFETVGGAFVTIVMFETEAAHEEKLTDQVSTVLPAVSPLIVELN
jgi:hypothetical protein